MPRLFRQLRTGCVCQNEQHKEFQEAMLEFADLCAENNEPITSALRA